MLDFSVTTEFVDDADLGLSDAAEVTVVEGEDVQVVDAEVTMDDLEETAEVIDEVTADVTVEGEDIHVVVVAVTEDWEEVTSDEEELGGHIRKRKDKKQGKKGAETGGGEF